jgi:hypothetical protein
MRKIFLNVTILLLISCSSNNNDLSHFDKEIIPTGVESTSILTVNEILNPNTIQLIGNKIIIGETSGTPAFHILEVNVDNSIDYLGGFGGEGRGPSEFTRLMDIISGDSVFYIYDGNQFKLSAFDLEGNYIDELTRTFQTSGLANSLFLLPNNDIIGAGVFLNERFQIFPHNQSEPNSHGELIMFDQSFTPRDTGLAWLSHATMDAKFENIYLFAENANFIEKYSIDGTLVKRVQGQEFSIPKMKLVDNWPTDNGGIVAHLKVTNNDENIFVNYSGKIRRDKFNNPFESTLIQQFDFDLNLTNLFELDHAPSTFVVTKENHLYSLANSENGFQIRKTQLK